MPTATFRILYVLVILSHARRRIVHFNVTDSPTSVWTARQLLEAFPWDSPHSPWQNPYVERVIGSIRRECLDHMIIFNENHLRRVLREYFRYYTESRTHLGLGKDCQEPKPAERRIPVWTRFS